MYGRVQKVNILTRICELQTISHDCFPLFYELVVQSCKLHTCEHTMNVETHTYVYHMLQKVTLCSEIFALLYACSVYTWNHACITY